MDKSHPLVSIGMPVYNGERFVRQALDSLLGQSFVDYELIISDNASTDRTQEICEEYAAREPRISYIRQATNNGGHANFSFVLQQARGEYFMWAAADDAWDASWLENMVRNFAADVAICFGGVVIINEDGQVIRTLPAFSFSKNSLVRLLQFYLCEETDGKANFIYGLYRCKRLRNHGLRVLENNKHGSDMLFVFDIIQDGYLRTDPDVRFYKRMRHVEKNILRQMPFVDRIRAVLLISALKYYALYPVIADGLFLKVVLVVLLPIKYVKSLVSWWCRILSDRLGAGKGDGGSA